MKCWMAFFLNSAALRQSKKRDDRCDGERVFCKKVL